MDLSGSGYVKARVNRGEGHKEYIEIPEVMVRAKVAISRCHQPLVPAEVMLKYDRAELFDTSFASIFSVRRKDN